MRIGKQKITFEKGFTTNWTEELFSISKVQSTKLQTYKIKDKNAEEVARAFSKAELQKFNQTIFRIEKVLKRRTKAGKK